MTNDMIALASNWEVRLRPQKCDKKEDPQVWATSFPHLLTLTQGCQTRFSSGANSGKFNLKRAGIM